MIQTLLFVLLALLLFIALKLKNVEKALTDLKSHRPSLSTSLNPLFSEEEVAAAKVLHDRWQKRIDRTFDALQRTEKKEIEAHHRSGRAKNEFAPSIYLKDLIQEMTLAICGRDSTQEKVQRMIEANIAIINGAKLREISESFCRDKDWGVGTMPRWAARGKSSSRRYSENK